MAATETEAWPEVSRDPGVQAHYEACRREGTSHALAEMFALAQPPMSNTDREFLEGHCNGRQFEKTPQIGDLYRRQAAAAGVDPTGKVYVSGLARFPGDPHAWVGGRGDVAATCEANGWACRGSVTVKGEPPPPVEVGVADDLVAEHAERAIESDPSLAERPRGEVLAETRDRIKPPWAD